MRSLITNLVQLRNDVVHSGYLPQDKDPDYALWLMKHLAHDLTMMTLHIVENDTVRTLNQLFEWLNKNGPDPTES